MSGASAEQRVAIITGAGSGVGRAVAISLAAEGFAVVLVGRRAGPLSETQGFLAHPDRAECLAADIAKPESAVQVVQSALQRFGRIDAIVNSAGVAPLKPIAQTTPEIIQEAYAINAMGPAYLIAAAWPTLADQHRRKSTLGEYRPCVVNISSMASLDPFPGFFAYAGSKAATNLMAKSCAKEGGAIGVRAFAVAPGAIETGMLRAMFDERAIPRDQTLSPEDVANVVVDCILGRRDSENGRVIPMSRTKGPDV